MSRRLPRFALVLATLTLALTSLAPASEALHRALDAALDSAVRERRVVGAVVMVAVDGTPVYRRAVGMADREANLAMWEGALFRLASVSKVFTAMAAARLVDEGRLALDNPVSLYVPYFTPALPNGEKPVITVRQLLNFTAGLDYGFTQPPDGPYARAGVSDGLDNVDLTLEENLRRLASAPLSSRPGERFNYSLALDVLGGVIAAASGTPFDQAMRDLVLDPLGLEDTGFWVGPDRAYRVATAYYNADPEPKRMGEESVSFGPMAIRFAPDRAFNPRAYPSGGAGLVASADDVLTLLEAIRTGGGPIAGADTIREFCRNQIGDMRMMPGVAFGLGVGVTVDQSETGAPEPDGTVEWSGVYGGNWFLNQDLGVSVVILTNTAFEGMAGQLVADVKQAVFGNLD